MEAVGGGGGEKEEEEEKVSSLTSWSTVEHFYQAQKFTHPSSSSSASSLLAADLEAARALVEAIRSAPTPVDAAALGRAAQRSSPNLVRPDWEDAKLDVMIRGLRAKFSSERHAEAREALLATHPRPIAEASPSDHFWGSGVDGSGCNHLGRLLAEVRAELLTEEESGALNGHHHQHHDSHDTSEKQQQREAQQQPSSSTKTTTVGR